MLFERCLTKNRNKYLKQHKKYFNFRSKMQLDHTVHSKVRIFTPNTRSNSPQQTAGRQVSLWPKREIDLISIFNLNSVDIFHVTDREGGWAAGWQRDVL